MRGIRIVLVAALALAMASAAWLTNPAAAAGGTSSISGVAFQDMNRNGVRDAGEAPFSGQHVQVLDASTGTYLQTVTTDANGAYTVGGLSDGPYTLQISSTDWNAMRDSWVTTTTGSLRPRITVQVSGAATANFGYRPLVKSTTLGQPISAATGPNGPRVEVYNDAVSASDVLADLLSGTLIGAEAQYTTLRLFYDTSSSTTSSATSSGGSYTSYSATSCITYYSWLDGGDQTMFHEYGHAWSMYYAYMVQQDPSLTGYIAARGLTGDSRLNSTYDWSPREMIAEDYRQLFGTPNAQTRAQANTEIPSARNVAGLDSYLSTTFRTAPASGSGSGTTSTSTTVTPLTISSLAVNPAPVTTSGTVTFSLSVGANTTVSIQTPSGTVVRTLASSTSLPSGTSSFTWDRKDAKGRKVRSGTYVASVVASSSDGQQASQSVSFSVS